MQLKMTIHVSDANIAALDLKKKPLKTEKIPDQKNAFLSISSRQRSLGHRASAQHFLSHARGIKVGDTMKVQRQDTLLEITTVNIE